MRLSMRFYRFLLVSAFLVIAVGAQDPQEHAEPPKGRCSDVLNRFVDLHGDGKPLRATWIHCPSYQEDDSQYWEPTQNFAVITDPDDNRLFTFGGVDELIEIKEVDLNNDARSELLLVGRGAGSGNFLTWCVLASESRRLGCLTAPDLELTAKKFLRDGEHLCCKDWTLKSDLNALVLGHGIYDRLDGNCCPSRGGIFIEVRRGDGGLKIVRSRRTDLKTYEKWLGGPVLRPKGW